MSEFSEKIEKRIRKCIRKRIRYEKQRCGKRYLIQFFIKVISVRGSNPLHVLIKKRENVKKYETIIKS